MKEVRIAISGKSGCGNTTVSRLLGERLGIRVINYTFRSMADEQGVSFQAMCRMAEEDESWDRVLDRRQVELAREGSCVLGSRLAIWVLPDADLSVYLTASTEVRAARIHAREGGALEQVKAETVARDARDRERYQRIYGLDNDNWSFADLVVDTEAAAPEEIVETIIEHLKQRQLL